MTLARTALGVIFIVGGVGHFVATPIYERIMPDYLPAHHSLVLLSGVAEIAGGLGILVETTRQAAAWGLVSLLIAVFPANLWMAQHPDRYPGVPLWALWLRLPLQLPIIFWAWRYTRQRLP